MQKMMVVRQRPFSYRDAFENIRLLGKLFAPDDFTWTTELPPDAPHLPFILHLSCMVHYTPHIPYLAQKIMATLGLECPILGGPENCCGTLHKHLGDERFAEQTGRIGIAGFRRAKPQTVLSICPDCDEAFALLMPKSKPFYHSNISELFVEQLEKLRPYMRPVPRRVVLHVHDYNEGRRRDSANIETILRAVPGLDIAVSERHRGPGAHCQILAPMAKEEQEAMFTEAVSLGADTVVMPYHSCYRQHIKMELRHRLNVQHYLSILGEALDIRAEETYKQVRLLDDVDKSVEALRPKFEPLGYTAEQIRPLVQWGVYV